MNHPHHPGRGVRHGLLAAALGIGSMAALAASPDLPPLQKEGPVSFVSGGVGESQEQAFKREMSRFPLVLEIVRHMNDKDHYTADSRVTVRDSQGGTVLQTVATGPFLLADLPPGTYDVEVDLHGDVKRQRVSVDGRSTGERTVFVFQGKP